MNKFIKYRLVRDTLQVTLKCSYVGHVVENRKARIRSGTSLKNFASRGPSFDSALRESLMKCGILRANLSGLEAASTLYMPGPPLASILSPFSYPTS